MFKYISEILSQFTKSQKILALILILISIIVLTVAPIIIKSNDELKSEIELKMKKIEELEKDISNKDTQIRNSQKECTNEIVEREKEFIEMLDRLRDRAVREELAINKTLNNQALYMLDTIASDHSPHPSVIIKGDMSGMIKEIDDIKSEIKK